ncbi:MAG TPA: GNAT family protein [Candidatus Dormibacteraeota bacterium]|nr:GNAT family protein [Candidatus Dormibacteraeota bacterium]
MNLAGWKGARPVERAVLEGETVRLEPLDRDRHARQLHSAAAGADEIWEHLAYGPFRDFADFNRWLAERAALSDPLTFAVVDRAGGDARGVAALMRIVPVDGAIEVGHIWFTPRMQRTRQATEAIYLLARHVFDDLGYRRFEWKCDSLNVKSRRAAQRFGFVFEGIFRQHMVVKGRNRDTAWFSIIDSEWPSRRAAFEAWLDPGNFDAAGRQVQSLTALRAE